MNKDYSYCLVKTECIHRRGCKRWINNYSDADIYDLLAHAFASMQAINYIPFNDCIPDYSDVNCENDFNFLDRFRLSDGRRF